jgi:hypothetical protein
VKINVKNAEKVVKEAFWLAWQASRVFGMGHLKASPGETKESVWKNVKNAGEYGEGAAELMGSNKTGMAYGDYVFGRMMKLRIEYDRDSITVRDDMPIPGYQSWCSVYKTYQDLIEAAKKSLGQE